MGHCVHNSEAVVRCRTPVARRRRSADSATHRQSGGSNRAVCRRNARPTHDSWRLHAARAWKLTNPCWTRDSSQPARVNARRVEVERLIGVEAALLTQEAQVRNQISELQLASISAHALYETRQPQRNWRRLTHRLRRWSHSFIGASERLKRVAITAPVSGRVVEMTVFTAGGVVRPGAPYSGHCTD